jgi:hypothetical protein
MSASAELQPTGRGAMGILCVVSLAAGVVLGGLAYARLVDRPPAAGAPPPLARPTEGRGLDCASTDDCAVGLHCVAYQRQFGALRASCELACDARDPARGCPAGEYCAGCAHCPSQVCRPRPAAGTDATAER